MGPSHTASESESSDEEVSVRRDTPPRLRTPEVLVLSKSPSPQHVSIRVSFPPTFPVITSQPSSTIPIPTPIFLEATTTTTTGIQTNVSNTGVRSSPPETPVTTKPPSPIFVEATTTTTMGIQTNISNTGVRSSPPETPVTTKPRSPTCSTETNTVLRGEDLEFDSTYFSPYRVQSDDDDDAPLTKRHLMAMTDKLDQLLSSSSTNPYSEAALKALFSSAVKEHYTSISNAANAIDASTSQCLKAPLAVESSTKDCKEATAKIEKLISEAQIFLDSLQSAAWKNTHTVNASAELSQLGVARKAIEAANEELHSKLLVENRVMDELDMRTSQLKFQNLKLCTVTQELNDLNSEREVIRSSISDVHSILLHLWDAHEVIVTIYIRRHLAEKLRPALDILSRIKAKATAGPKDNEASVSKSQKKKKIIGEDDEDEEDDIDDIVIGSPSKLDPKFKPSEQELQEKMDRLEKEMKEKELLEKKKSMFPEWTIESLQREVIDELSTHWL
uniref:Uncharacterized protein n=1 Tax=Lactuca sativa TaxID=4236 RepID=A0A9R1WAY6_LACSA|nr:hypothetical protein LSAT_V11C200062850 [Lactuca sativa]